MYCNEEIHEILNNDDYYDCPFCCERINDNIEFKREYRML